MIIRGRKRALARVIDRRTACVPERTTTGKIVANILPAVWRSLLVLATVSVSAMSEESVYDFTVKDANGNDKPLSDFKDNRVMLIVNVASK